MHISFLSLVLHAGPYLAWGQEGQLPPKLYSNHSAHKHTPVPVVALDRSAAKRLSCLRQVFPPPDKEARYGPAMYSS